jgi:hypothetical protein
MGAEHNLLLAAGFWQVAKGFRLSVYNSPNFANRMESMKFLKFTCGTLLVAAAGFVLGFILLGAGFISLWWGFPGDWQPLEGVTEAPQQILALRAEEAIYLLRIANGALYTCHEQFCTSELTDWSTPDTRCDVSHRPATTSLLPVFAARGIRVVLACERSYTDIGRTIFVIQIAGRGNYMSGGVSLIPTDAGVIGVALLGGLVGMMVSLLVCGIVFLVRRASHRRLIAAGSAGEKGVG